MNRNKLDFKLKYNTSTVTRYHIFVTATKSGNLSNIEYPLGSGLHFVRLFESEENSISTAVHNSYTKPRCEQNRNSTFS